MSITTWAISTTALLILLAGGTILHLWTRTADPTWQRWVGTGRVATSTALPLLLLGAVTGAVTNVDLFIDALLVTMIAGGVLSRIHQNRTSRLGAALMRILTGLCSIGPVILAVLVFGGYWFAGHSDGALTWDDRSTLWTLLTGTMFVAMLSAVDAVVSAYGPVIMRRLDAAAMTRQTVQHD